MPLWSSGSILGASIPLTFAVVGNGLKKDLKEAVREEMGERAEEELSKILGGD